MSEQLPEHVARNREAWNQWAADFAPSGERCWAMDQPTWGIWDLADEAIQLLPADMAGMRAIELGCGTGYISAWMTRRGARVVGIDNSPAQLETAFRLREQHGLEIEFLLGNAEDVPLPDASFDFAVSEYGASIWCDPYKWIPEAARLLKVGGELRFLVGGAWMMCTIGPKADDAASKSLVRPYFGMHRFEWEGCPEVEFHLGHGDLFQLLKSSGFEVTDFLELQAGAGAPDTRFEFVTAEWAHQWPSEEVWKARKVW